MEIIKICNLPVMVINDLRHAIIPDGPDAGKRIIMSGQLIPEHEWYNETVFNSVNFILGKGHYSSHDMRGNRRYLLGAVYKDKGVLDVQPLTTGGIFDYETVQEAANRELSEETGFSTSRFFGEPFRKKNWLILKTSFGELEVANNMDFKVKKGGDAGKVAVIAAGTIPELCRFGNRFSVGALEALSARNSQEKIVSPCLISIETVIEHMDRINGRSRSGFGGGFGGGFGRGFGRAYRSRSRGGFGRGSGSESSDWRRRSKGQSSKKKSKTRRRKKSVRKSKTRRRKKSTKKTKRRPKK